jgi:tRNA A-37 threonylcarbamoyl transferase component Bud32
MAGETLISKRVGRYEIRERIGAGGMARVFKAWDTNLDRMVAMKILHEHLVEEAGFKERFEREAKTVAALNQPNIVQVYDYDMVEVDGQKITYMVMQYIPGKTLKEELTDLRAKRERMNPERARDILLDLCAALGYAHSRGMVHRDVKPANILFDEHGKAVLADFGIARLAEGSSLTQDGSVVGTPTYMSPEQASGMPVDARGDLYALGIILYEMLASQPPFHDENTLSLILKHMNAPVPSLSDYLGADNPELDQLIFKALAKDPDARYQTAEAFADAIVRVLGGQVRAVTRVSEPPPARATVEMERTAEMPKPGARRSPLIILVAGFAIIAVMGIIALAMNGRGKEATPTPTAALVANKDFSTTFSRDVTSEGWPIGDDTIASRKLTNDGFYRFENRIPGKAITSIFNPNYVYDAATITMDAMLDAKSPAASGYGIVFNYADDRNYNVFAVDGARRYSIWALEDGAWRELRNAKEKWTHDDAVNPLGQSNRLMLNFDAEGHFIGSVNGQKLADVKIAGRSGPPGNVGIYLAATQDGGATALVDSYQVSVEVESMTAP